jgi:RND family efflux transporter MFP subunit
MNESNPTESGRNRPMSERAPQTGEQNQRQAQHHGSRSRLVVFWLILFVVFGVLAFLSLSERRSSSRALADQTIRDAVPYVSVIHADQVPGESELILPGTMQAYIESPIYARTNGYLKNWYKDIGSHVKKGELLADIETPEVDQQLDQAKADLATAQANLALSQTTATRYQDLIKTDSVSKQEVDNATGDLAAKKSTVQSAQANVQRLEDLESFKHVYAPFDGVITRRNTDIGQLINAGNGGAGAALFDMAQVDPMRVFVAVPQSFAPSIRVGLKACLTLQEIPGRDFCGAVARTADSIDLTTRTLNTEVDVPNRSGELLPGAYAEVHFNLHVSAQRLSLPVNALVFRPEGTMAAVVVDDKIQLKPLTTGRDLGSVVEVLGGITTSDAIVVNPPDALENGQQVHITQGNNGNAPGQNSPQNGSKNPPPPAKKTP